MSTTHRPIFPYHATAEQREQIERHHAQHTREQKLAELAERVGALEDGRTHPKAVRSITVEHAPVRPYFATNT